VAATPLEIEPLPNRTIDLGYFGIHVHRAPADRGRLNGKDTEQWWNGFGAIRLWDSRVRWADLQPSAAVWDFTRLDSYVAEATMHGRDIVLVLGSTPKWASARASEPCPYGYGCAAEPTRLEDWDAYVAAVAGRYKNKIKYYEIWNEPYPGRPVIGNREFYTGSMATLVELGRRAAKIIKREDRGAMVLTPGFIGPVRLLDEFLEKGGKDFVDGIAYHFYATSTEQFIDWFARLRAVARKHGLENLPILNTESSFTWWEGAGWRRTDGREADASYALGVDLQGLVLGAFMGVDRWFYYSWDSKKNGHVDSDGRPTASFESIRRLTRSMIGGRPMGCRPRGRSLLECTLQKGDRRLAFVWQPRYEPQPEELALGPEVEGVDGLAGPTLDPSEHRINVGHTPLVIRYRPR
jgi:hypothetical protein